MKYCILFFFIATQVAAQSPLDLDSLKHQLRTAPDLKERIHSATELVEEYRHNQVDSARLYLNIAMDLAQKQKDPLIQARVFNLDAVLLQYAAAYEPSLQSSQKALAIYESLGDKKRMGNVLNNIGLTYKKMGDAQKVVSLTQKALEYTQKALEIYVSINDTLKIIGAYNNFGIIYRDLERIDEAEKAYLKGLEMAQPCCMEKVDIALLYGNLAQIYVEKRRDYATAISYLEKALRLNEKLKNKKGIEHNYRTLSEAFREKKDFEKAIFYAEKSVNMAQELKDVHRSFNAYEVLSKAQEAAGLYQKSLESFKIMKTLEDSTVRFDKTKAIAEMENKYEAAKKQIEITRLNEKNHAQRQQLIGGALFVALLLGLLGLLFFQNKKIKNSERQITEQADQLKLMMRELHHRVKNNLAIVSSLLKIQSSKLTDEQAVKAVQQGQQRVEAMSLIHQRLYQTDKISEINIKEYITDLVESLMQAYGYAPDNFDLHLTVEQERLDVDTAMPMGLIINELLTNSFKHAFENIKKPSLTITLKTNNGLQLDIKDNGKGVDLERWRTAKDSFGKKLIVGLSKQINGDFSVENDNGARFKLFIPEEKLRKAA